MSADNDSRTVASHTTSLAIWDVPSPIVINQRARLKIGAKCSASCSLAGETVHVLDETGATVGTGRLDESPWPGTIALFWAEVEVTAPPSEGACSWSVGFASRQGQRHEAVSAAVGVFAVRPSEHRIKIEVVDQTSEAAVEGVALRVGPYRAATDGCGMAFLDVAGAAYTLTAWKAGYTPASQAVTVTDNLSLQIGLVPEAAREEPYWM